MLKNPCFLSFNNSKGQKTPLRISFEDGSQEADFHQNVVLILKSSSFSLRYKETGHGF